MNGLDFRTDKESPLVRKALFSYITHPFSISAKDSRFYRHINIWRAKEMVKILNNLGYIVDVIDYRDVKFIPRKAYDIFIGHGSYNFEKIARNLDGRTIKIYFTTGNYWKFRNQEISTRFKALRDRKGFDFSPDRLQNPDEEGVLEVADGVIGIGGDFSSKTYNQFSDVIMINTTALFDDHYANHDKNFDKGRTHFLYYAGPGNVHKGLDLLLEAFTDLDQRLWICSFIDKAFAEAYSNELNNYSNIHLLGWIQPRSVKFYEIIEKCNFVILPSCSEGQAHSVVECMNQGLIPVVSRACGIKIDGFGEILDPCSTEEIKRAVSKLAKISPDLARKMSVKARTIIKKDFSEQAFHNNMRNAILKISSKSRSNKTKVEKQIEVKPMFVDECHNVSYDRNAIDKFKEKNDIRYLENEKGVTEIDLPRWWGAQRFEWRSWMDSNGLNMREDRNKTHGNGFENYSTIKGKFFENAIELGCGPFTNMRHIMKHINCQKITLLDPLIRDYLTHPHCTYKKKRLNGWFGKKVEMIDLPIEKFSAREKFDLVVIVNVLEHCYSLTKVFECILSITAPNGTLLFHDKLIPDCNVTEFVHTVYDTGHPLRVAEGLIFRFLNQNYDTLFQRQIPVKTAFGKLDSLYFIGQKK
ncbi:MAG: glycosyltransferase [bacterium]|nr:MAG: glycosyltransferase [bacterium]